MTKFYTIQPRRVWKKFLKQGFIEGNKDFAMFPEHYIWMIEEMKKRLPKYKGEYPVWLWTEIDSYRYDYSMTARKKFVILTIELDDKDVLLSDFDAWHIPLNNCSFIDGESDWDKIFDFDWLRKNFYENDDKKIYLQGTTGRIPIEKVIKVKNFTTKKERI